jgi:hypothetical protein
MAEEKKFTSLVDLLRQKDRINLEAAAQGHDGFFPVAVQVPQSDGKTVTRGQTNPTPKKDGAYRGRILLFEPTKERVTILKERVGQSYQGDWLHEVTTREGHKFLAMQKQLKDLVK